MGLSTAIGIAATETTLKQQISWHLAGNHYPPIPQVMVPVCIEAIDAYWEEDYDRLIQLPIDGLDRNGEPFQVRWRDGSDKAPAHAIIEHAHLDAWLSEMYLTEEDEEDE
jgi:hypothetical protein